MASSSSILNANQGRAAATALGILCVLVMVQIGLIVKVITEQPPMVVVPVAPAVSAIPVTAPTLNISPPPVGQLAPAPSVPPVQTAVTPSFGPPPFGSFQAPNAMPPPPLVAQPPVVVATPTAPKPPVPSTKPSAKTTDPAAGMSLAEMIDLAKQVRGLGDMQGALEVLKRADLQFPATPEVAAETALSYEQMGLTDKATTIWKQIASMDPEKSAGFADLAKRKLNAASAGVAASASGTSFAGDFAPKSLSLGACIASKDPSVANGEKVVLRVPILRQGNAAVDPAQVDIDVYFFDRVNGEKVAQTIADEPLSQWGAPPVDWSGVGEEPLEVTYFLPALTPGEIAAHGRRSYHGYVVRLYYQHKLQDVAAEPRDLLDFGSRAPQSVPGGVNPLLPPVSN
ncbi:MAG: hypothetical protein ABL974_01705 [Prosthecobacter sp.]